MDTFEIWGIVELFGHTRIAGKLSETTIAGQGFLKVEAPALPETERWQAQEEFTRIYGPGAIYSIIPTTEAVALACSRTMRGGYISGYPTVIETKLFGPTQDIDGLADEGDYEDEDEDHPF